MKPSVQRFVCAPVVAVAFWLAGCAEPSGPERADSPPALASLSVNAGAGEATAAEGRHLVLFKPGARIDEVFAGEVSTLGGAVEAAYPSIGVAVVTGLDAGQAATLTRVKGVQGVECDEVVSLDLPPLEPLTAEVLEAQPASPDAPGTAFFHPRQWHLRAIAADRAWVAGRLGSSSVTVAILDTEIDYAHVDLAGRVDLSRSRSFHAGDDALVAQLFPSKHPVTDLHYHGTHVAATVSSNALAAAGVTSKVTLIGVKVLGVNGSGPTSGVLAGIVYAADAGADVINMSLGSAFSLRDFPGFVSVINRAITYANGKGVTVVVAAGNAALDLDHNGDQYAAYCDAPALLCVAATGPTSAASVNGPWQEIDAPAPYSNYGRSAVSVAGPGGTTGGAVWAACSTTSLVVPVCRTGTFVVGLGGTSMASPHAAGLAALLVESYGRNPGRIRAAIQSSADDLGAPGTDPYYGKGRINVARALGL